MKKMFKSLLMSALVLATGAFVACEPQPEEQTKFEGQPEISAVADVDGLTLEGGVVTVTVTSNAPWTAEVNAEDVTLSKTSGNGDATVTVTVPAATAARDLKVTFTAVGYMMGIELTATAEVSIVQNATGKLSISGLTPETVGDGVEVELEEVLVVATGSQAYMIADETGAIVVYHSGHGRTVGDKINISGLVTIYTSTTGSFYTPQFSADAVVEVVSTGNEVTHNPAVVEGEAFANLVSNTVAKEVEFVATWEVSGNYVNLTVDGSSKQGSIKYVDNSLYSSFAGQAVVVKGYYVGLSVSGSNNYVNVMPYSVESDPNSPQLNVDKTQITFAATDGSGARATFTATTNGLEGYELTWSIDNTNDFTLGKQLGSASRTTLYVTPKAANNGAAKTANVLVTYSNGTKTLTKSVKVVQEGTTATTYTMIDKAANLTAGTYYVAAYCEKDSNSTDLAPYIYHFFNGSVASGDLTTSAAQFANGELTVKDGEAEIVSVVLEAADGGKFYVKNSKDGKYIKSTDAANRKLALTDEKYAWTAEDHANGGVALTDGSVWIGSASATKNYIRSYNASSKCKFGLYFVK